RPVADVRSTLVAVDERMVSRDPERQAGRQRCEVGWRLAIRMQLPGTSQRRFQQGLVTDAGVAAVFGYLALVDGQGKRTGDPDDHAAAIRRACGGHCDPPA